MTIEDKRIELEDEFRECLTEAKLYVGVKDYVKGEQFLQAAQSALNRLKALLQKGQNEGS